MILTFYILHVFSIILPEKTEDVFQCYKLQQKKHSWHHGDYFRKSRRTLFSYVLIKLDLAQDNTPRLATIDSERIREIQML